MKRTHAGDVCARAHRRLVPNVICAEWKLWRRLSPGKIWGFNVNQPVYEFVCLM